MGNPEKYRRRRVGAIVAIAAFAFFLHATAGAGAEPELHTIRPGDTLWSVATEQYPATEDPRVNVEKIRAENDLKGYKVRPGETLRIPQGRSS